MLPTGHFAYKTSCLLIAHFAYKTATVGELSSRRSAQASYPHLYLSGVPVGGDHFGISLRSLASVTWSLWNDIVCVILCSAILAELPTCDRQTETDGHMMTAYTVLVASIASRGNIT